MLTKLNGKKYTYAHVVDLKCARTWAKCVVGILRTKLTQIVTMRLICTKWQKLVSRKLS